MKETAKERFKEITEKCFGVFILTLIFLYFLVVDHMTLFHWINGDPRGFGYK